MFRKDTTSRGHQRELARKGRHRSQLRVPTWGGMSTDGPQPTQGAPKKKKKKESRSVVFWDCFFVPCFLFLFFWRPLAGIANCQADTARKTQNAKKRTVVHKVCCCGTSHAAAPMCMCATARDRACGPGPGRDYRAQGTCMRTWHALQPSILDYVVQAPPTSITSGFIFT
jgi:hypothetical protein